MISQAATVLIEELRSLGVSLSLAGEKKLRYRGAREVITPDLLERIGAQKQELLEILRVETPEDLAESEILETRVTLGAVRVRSRLLSRDIWLAVNERAAAELRTDMAPGEEIPILLLEDVVKLRGKSTAMIHAVLDTAGVFPLARIVQ